MRKLILTILLVSSVQTFASSNKAPGNDGGGGGVICFANNKCITLAEAGLRITKSQSDNSLPDAPPAVPVGPPPAPIISKEVAQEVEMILGKLPQTPIKFTLTAFHIGVINPSERVFKKVEMYDAKKFEVVKNEYIQILKENNFPSDNFDIAAVSDKDTTYLLPNFYKLNRRSQALTLIHEAVVRETQAMRTEKFNSVKFAMELDGFLVDLLNDKSTDLYALTAWTEKLALIFKERFSSKYEEYLNSELEKELYYGSPQMKFMYSQQKKYKVPDLMLEAVIGGLVIGGEGLQNVYVANAIYQESPELWNYLNNYKIRDTGAMALFGVTSIFDLLPPTFVSKLCVGAVDGHYFTGSHIIKCEKSKMTEHTPELRFRIDNGTRYGRSLGPVRTD